MNPCRSAPRPGRDPQQGSPGRSRKKMSSVHTLKDMRIRIPVATGSPNGYRAISLTGPNIPHGTGCTACKSCS